MNNNINIINIGLNGTFRETGKEHTHAEDIDALFEYLSTTETKKIVLYFHGGLVNEQNGRKTAEKMWNLLNEEAYTIAFVWKTGFLEILKKQLEAIYHSPLFQKITQFVSFRSFNYLGGDSVRGGGKGSSQVMTKREVERELQRENPFEQFDKIVCQEAEQLNELDLNNIEEQLKEQLRADLEKSSFDKLIQEYAFQDLLIPEMEGFKNPETEIDQTRKGLISSISSKVLALIAFNVVKRYWQKRDHGFYPTVVEEIFRAIYLNQLGKWIWERMKNTSKEMWKPNQGEINADSYVGTYFLEKLVVLKQKHPDLVIDLVGHSAGSICICHLLNAVSERFTTLKIRNVIFMAPACISDLFNENIVNKQNFYQNFRMFTMRNELEIQDHLVPGIYTRSLLYFISGVLEDTADKPIAGLEYHLKGKLPSDHDSFKHYGDDDAKLRSVREFLLAPDSNRLVLSQTTTNQVGLNSNSTHHGDFDSDDITLQSLRDIISS